MSALGTILLEATDLSSAADISRLYRHRRTVSGAAAQAYGVANKPTLGMLLCWSQAAMLTDGEST